MSSNGGEGGGGSLISEKAIERIKYFDENGKSKEQNIKVVVGELYLQSCEITDEMLEEIILEWFIKKKLFDKIKG